ncbi:hypothetical protein BCON_0830g00010 [Botryotinia convoluta]|uniref:Uncharacterized protein n=1 Tax=Botryotinia convoluta TaxID=54673 RepID=A0A4Z1H6Z6_9HELO|nr:hypothetical protein BCON_0830g00010 [Botryotinia convoluta]
MNDLEEAEFLISLAGENKTLLWPSFKVWKEFQDHDRLVDKAYEQQQRKRIAPEQLARQRRRMAIIMERRQRRQRS